MLNNILLEENFKLQIKLNNGDSKEKDLATMFKEHLTTMEQKTKSFNSNMD